MSNVIDELLKLNIEMGEAETRGDYIWLDEHLAPRFSIMRADGKTFHDRQEFLNNVKASPLRITPPEAIDINIIGNRAIVKCIVKFQGKCYHNLRLFVVHEEKWKILGWANELLTGNCE